MNHVVSGDHRRKLAVGRWPGWVFGTCLSVACGASEKPSSSSASDPTGSGGNPGATGNVPPGGGGAGGSVSTAPDEGGPNIVGVVGSAGAGGTSSAGPAGAGTGGTSSATPGACDASTANAAGYCWGSVKIGGGGFVSGIVTSRQEPNLIFARTDVGGAYRWSEGTHSWIPLNDWVAEDQVGFLGVESLALDPTEPNRIYMLAGINYFNGGKTAVLSSADYGATFSVHEVTSQFKAHGNGAGRQSGERLAVDPNLGTLLYTGTRDAGLFKSNDRGASWARVAALDVTTTPNGNGIAFVVFDPRSGVLEGATRTIYVGVSRVGGTSLLRSTDAGASWNAIAAEPTAYVPQRATLTEEGILYVTYANGAGPSPSNVDSMDRGEIWKLDTTSGNWTDITPLRGDANRAFGGISVAAADPNRLLATTINTYQQQPWGYGDRIFLSLDAGASWSDLIGSDRVAMDTNGFPWIENQAIHWAGSAEIDPFNPERAFITSGNGVFMTSDLSAPRSTWSFEVDGLEETVPLDVVSLPGVPLVSVIGDYDGFVHDDLDQSPIRGRHRPSIGTTSGLAAAAASPQHLARVGSALYLSSDGAASWFEVPRPTADTGGHLALSADAAVLLWTVGDTVHRTADQGANWTVSSGLGGRTVPIADSVNPSTFYAYDSGAGGFYVSVNGGQSFATTTSLPVGGVQRIQAAPGVAGDVWVALAAGGLTRSLDAGGSFERIPGVATCRAVGFGAAAPDHDFPSVYIWGSAADGPRGMYRSDDAGATWLRVNDDQHAYGGPGNGDFVLGDVNTYGRVFMSTAGRGLVVGNSVTP